MPPVSRSGIFNYRKLYYVNYILFTINSLLFYVYLFRISARLNDYEYYIMLIFICLLFYVLYYMLISESYYLQFSNITQMLCEYNASVTGRRKRPCPAILSKAVIKV